jgi:hypothetical protein
MITNNDHAPTVGYAWQLMYYTVSTFIEGIGHGIVSYHRLLLLLIWVVIVVLVVELQLMKRQ